MHGLHELASLVRRHVAQDRPEGTGPMLSPGLQLISSSVITEAQQLVYEPMLCVILEGAKTTTLGSETHTYRAGQYLVVSADLPVSGQVIAAPYLAVGVPLSPPVIADLLAETGAVAPETAPVRALAVSDMDPDLIDVTTRLIRLLDRPREAAVLAPMIRRELMWRLLSGERADLMRQIASADARLEQVRRVIRWLREHYAEPMRIDALAEVGAMSATSLHRHFKAVTAMSPLQYQKQLRLQEARNLLLSRGRDMAAIGYAVGYDSPSQFSREYRRVFGHPPGRDLQRLRAEASRAGAV